MCAGLPANASVPDGAVIYNGREGAASAAAGDNVRVLCSKPGGYPAVC